MMRAPKSARMTASMTAWTSDQAPSPGACLDDLLVSRFLPRGWMERIWSAHELPPRFQHCARNLKPGAEWRAYGSEDQIFFAIARMHVAAPTDAPPSAIAPPTATPPSSAIEAYFFDENAAVYAAGVWDHDRRTGWCLDAVMEPSYDSEHGWWLGDLIGPGDAAGPRSDSRPAASIEFRRRKPHG